MRGFGGWHPRSGRYAQSFAQSPCEITGQADQHNSKAREKRCDGQALSKGTGRILCLLASIIQIKAICPKGRPIKKPM